MDLQNKVALVTGSARRVGKVIALALARHGMHLVITHGHSPEAAAETVQETEALGVRAIAVQADLADVAQIDALFEAIQSEYGRVDVVVNSASTWEIRDFLELTPDGWDHVMAVNLRAPFLISQHAIRLMLAQGEGGAIINISDTGAVRPYLRLPDHGVSKAGLIALTEYLGKRFARDGLRVNAIMPGHIMQSEGLSDERWARFGEAAPLGSTGSAEAVAEAVVALASLDYINGATLKVDGAETLIEIGDIVAQVEQARRGQS